MNIGVKSLTLKKLQKLFRKEKVEYIIRSYDGNVLTVSLWIKDKDVKRISKSTSESS